MRRLVAFIPLVVLTVGSCETESLTSPQADSRLAIYPTADFTLKGTEYSAITPEEIQGEQCQWIVDGDAMVTYWSRPDCEAVQGVTMWIEYTAWLTRGVWRIGANAINTGAGLGLNPKWYPEFWLGNSLTSDVITVPASDTEVNHGYTEYKVSSDGLYTIRLWWQNDKFDDQLMLDANLKIISVFFEQVPGNLHEGPYRQPYQWSVHDLPWPGGIGEYQLQSVYPLDAKGDLVLVGGQGIENDYAVFDLSSGGPVLLASSGNLSGYKTAAFSLTNAPVGFGGGDALVKYDGGFQLIPMPCDGGGTCSITGVWASSPTDVWVTRYRLDTEGIYHSEIWYWDGDGFALEYEGEAGFSSHIHLWDIWGFGSVPMFAVGERLLQRDRDGGWQEILGPDDLPPTCTFLSKVKGIQPSDVWASDFWGACLLHYDGVRWSEMRKPGGHASLNTIWPLSGQRLFWAGQGRGDVATGRIPIWGSVNGGRTWSQVQDPVFAQLPSGSYSAFFDLAGTVGGTRFFAPTIHGGRLVIGSLTPFRSHVVATASAMARLADTKEFVLPEAGE